MAVTVLSGAGVSGTAQAADQPNPSPQPYEIELLESSEDVTSELLDAAAAVDGTLRLVRFEGESGVGEIVVADGISAGELDRQAVELFRRVDAAVPPVVAAVVVTEQTMDAGVLSQSGLTATVHALDEGADG